MYQIDVASAAAELPAAAAAGIAGFFTSGDPVSGQGATELPADFMNTLMLELLGVLTGAGLNPSKADNGQLAKSMPLISGSLATELSLTFPSGVTIKVGSGVTADGSGTTPIVFQTPFKTGCVGFATNRANGPPSAFHGIDGESKTGMTVHSASASSVAPAAGTAFRYLAIGF